MKKIIVLYALIAVSALFFQVLETGCNTNQHTIAYKTIYSVEKSGTATYDGYLDCVISGQCSTNGVADVSKTYNRFQASVTAALDVVQFQTNAIAPDSLVTEEKDLENLISSFIKK